MSRYAELHATLADADTYYEMMIAAGEHPNLDRMGYLSHMTLETFRRLLGEPHLNADELAGLMRAARDERRLSRIPRPLEHTGFEDTTEDRAAWTAIMSRFVDTRANQN
jgi:hypothetical protein